MQIQHNIHPQEKLARLRLARTRNVGPATYRQLISRTGSAETALRLIPDLAKRGGKSLVPYPKAAAEKEIAALTGFGGEWLVLGEASYPELLSHIEDAPPVLFLKGNSHLLDRACVGIVGARNASAIGCKMAQTIAYGLGLSGYTVVSGLARGIDAAAHTTSLKTGTVAAIAGGLDIIYPRENTALQEAIGEQGLLISEMPMGTSPQARHFPRRNRIISGLSLGVVVVEAAARSGSLITARLALEYGREVMAVPGSPLDPRSQGCNALIRQGAALIESAQDVIEVLKILGREKLRDRTLPLFAYATGNIMDPSEQDRAKLLQALNFSPVSMDEIVRNCALDTALVATMVLEFELAGRIERHAGNRISMRAE